MSPIEKRDLFYDALSAACFVLVLILIIGGAHVWVVLMAFALGLLFYLS